MIDPKHEVKELRKFALTLFFALGILGAALVWRKRDIGFLLSGVGAAVLIIAWGQPLLLRLAYRYWMRLAVALGLVTSHIVLALLYYLVVTPIGLMMRVFGKNPLALQLDQRVESYWIRKENRNPDKQRYEKMF